MDSAAGNEEKLKQLVLPGNCSGCVDWEKKLQSLRSEVLIESAEAGHVECVEALLAAGADVNTTNIRRETALLLATKEGHSGCVDALIRAGGDVNAFDDQYNRAVVYAAQNGYDKCMELLTRAGADVHCTQPEPLRCAVEKGHLKCAELLIEAGADVNIQDNHYPWSTTPLICAAAKGLDNFVRFLIEAGADVNKEAGRMVVVRPLKYDDKRCVKLADLPGRISGCRNPSDPPLVHAVICGQAKCLDIILQAGAVGNRPGAGVNEESYLDRAMLHAAGNGSEQCLTLLLKTRADVNKQNQDGCTALMAASQYGHDHCVNLLIGSGADVNKALSDEYSNYTALTFSAVYCRKRCVDMLIKAGSDVNKVNCQGYSVLMIAANSKQSSNCNEKYHCAIKRFDVRCIKALLRAGATVNSGHGNSINKVEVTITKELPADVIVLLFVAGEIFTENQLKDIVQQAIFTKQGDREKEDSDDSGDDYGDRRDDRGDEEDQDVVRDLDHVTWEDWVGAQRTVIAPESFWKVSLKMQCRLAVREHLLKLDVNGNLFQRIPLLGLPKIMTQYLLYNVSLDYGDDNELSL